MNEEKRFDYYYGAESEQFSFIRIPKLLLQDPMFSGLQKKADLLYGLLLDRMSLSAKHGWIDKNGRVFIRYKIREISGDMNISETSATGYLKELEKIGLVEKERIGLGQGNTLYVKNFVSGEQKESENNNMPRFDYFYGSAGSQFAFIRIPKLLLFDPKFKGLSTESIILYGLLLDRMGLSMMNDWIDENGRVYVRFKIKEIQDTMRVFETTAANYLKELEEIGLVEKKRIGIAQGNILYVKNFISADLKSKAFITHKIFSNGVGEITGKTMSDSKKCPDNKTFKASKTGINKEITGNAIKEFGGNNSTGSYGFSTQIFVGNGATESAGQNNTKINNTKYNNNPYPIISEKEDKYYTAYLSRIKRKYEDDGIGLMDDIDRSNIFREGIRDQVDYDYLMEYQEDDMEIIDEIIELMVEMMLDGSPTIRISGKALETRYVKKILFQIDRSHINYMLHSLKNTRTKIGNIKSYMRATIFNSYFTKKCFYRAEVNHNVFGSAV